MVEVVLQYDVDLDDHSWDGNEEQSASDERFPGKEEGDLLSKILLQ